jgi:hypothetical protein
VSFSDLQFERYATEEDLRTVQDIAHGWSLWREQGGDKHYWLAPGDVMQHGLTDRMRAALAEEAVGGPLVVEKVLDRDGVAQPVVRPPEATGRPPIEAIGGHSAEWRWDRVVDGEHVVWAIDNKPAVDAWAQGDRTEPCPPLQRVLLPHEILQIIAKT